MPFQQGGEQVFRLQEGQDDFSPGDLESPDDDLQGAPWLTI